MKRFLLQLLLFISIFAVVWFGSAFMVSKGVKNQKFTIDSTKTIVVLGHSMGETAINPQIVTNVANYCQSAEHYMQSYLKLKYLLRDNKNIDTVLLTLSPSIFGSNVDEALFEGDFAVNKMKLYYPLMDWSDIKPFLWTKILYTNISAVEFAANLLRGNQYVTKLGGYLHLERNKLQNDIEIRENSDENLNDYKYGDEFQRLYFEKIIDLCKANNIVLMFIQMPIYKADKYFDIPLSDSIRMAIAPQIDVLDFINLQLPDSLYGDITHLNYKGAELFSHILQDSLSNRGVKSKYNIPER